jgi:hypothetical protein
MSREMDAAIFDFRLDRFAVDSESGYPQTGPNQYFFHPFGNGNLHSSKDPMPGKIK